METRHLSYLGLIAVWFSQDESVSRNKQLELQELAGELLPALSGGKARKV